MSDGPYPSWLTHLVGDHLFSAGSGVASILSFLLTLWVVTKLWRINAGIVLHGRKGPWLKFLRERASRLAPLLQDPERSKNEIREILIECRPTLRELMRSLPVLSGQRMRVFHLLAKVGRYIGSGLFRWFARRAPADQLPRSIYEDLLEVNQALNEAVAQARLYKPQV